MSLQLAKAQNLARVLKERLRLRFPTFTISESIDSVGVILSISQSSTPTTAEDNMLIRIKGVDTPFNDVIGQAQSVYSPHVMQIVEEDDAAAGSRSVITASSKAKLEWEISRMGVSQERYLRASGTPPAVGDILAANLIAKIDDLQWPLSGQ